MRVSAVAFARFVHTLTQLRLGSKAAKPAQPSPPRGEGKARDKPRDTAGQTHIAALFQGYRVGGPSRDILRRYWLTCFLRAVYTLTIAQNSAKSHGSRKGGKKSK